MKQHADSLTKSDKQEQSDATFDNIYLLQTD